MPAEELEKLSFTPLGESTPLALEKDDILDIAILKGYVLHLKNTEKYFIQD